MNISIISGDFTESTYLGPIPGYSASVGLEWAFDMHILKRLSGKPKVLSGLEIEELSFSSHSHVVRVPNIWRAHCWTPCKWTPLFRMVTCHPMSFECRLTNLPCLSSHIFTYDLYFVQNQSPDFFFLLVFK